MGITLQAPAKLNLYLGVHQQKDARGYHRVDSLMVAIDLSDEVSVEESAGLEVECTPSVDVAQEENTAYKAARLFAEAQGREPNVHISINKRIPAQSGMGGSSSDAAAVLKALCELWQVDARSRDVMNVARAVGADVPFFLDLRPTLLEGAGDTPREFFPSVRGVPVIVVRQRGAGISTKLAYEEFDRTGRSPKSPEAICQAMRRSDRAAMAQNLSNNLDPIACALKPEIGKAKEWLAGQSGVVSVQVTGSGSAVFGICETLEQAQAIQSLIYRKPAWWACATTML